MSFTIEKIPGEPIVILTVESKQVLTELAVFDEQLTAVLDAQNEQVFLIPDMSNISLSLDDLTVGANTIARGPGQRLHHPNVRENVMVTRDAMLKLAVIGLRTATFGSAHITVFDTREQALAYCRERIAEADGA